ncbi:Uncharacterised protein [Segatella copri]|nr:Uncharacterised protein [Segatella copri]
MDVVLLSRIRISLIVGKSLSASFSGSGTISGAGRETEAQIGIVAWSCFCIFVLRTGCHCAYHEQSSECHTHWACHLGQSRLIAFHVFFLLLILLSFLIFPGRHSEDSEPSCLP